MLAVKDGSEITMDSYLMKSVTSQIRYRQSRDNVFFASGFNTEPVIAPGLPK